MLLEHYWWGSVFLMKLPLAVVALLMAVAFVPSHVHESTDPVDNLGGLLSIVMVAALVLAINVAPVPNAGTLALGLAGGVGGSLVGSAVALWLGPQLAGVAVRPQLPLVRHVLRPPRPQRSSTTFSSRTARRSE